VRGCGNDRVLCRSQAVIIGVTCTNHAAGLLVQPRAAWTKALDHDIAS
jgi:hypothetical protein